MSWRRRFFRAPFYTPASPDALYAAPAEAAAAWRLLGLRKGAAVLDLGCGTGRHAVRLARRGADVVGLDENESYLREARRAASRSGVSRRCRFVCGDLRRLPFNGEFDAALSLWTSFGYFERASDDLKALKAAARALAPGGNLLVELWDFAAALRRGPAASREERPDGSVMLRETRFTLGRDPRFVCAWTLEKPGKRPERVEFSVRGYDRKRLAAALQTAGFEAPRFRTTLASGRWARAGMLVAIARKP